MASTALDGQRYNGQLWTSGEVADKLVGRTFANFDDFREAFWLAVADTKYIDEFSEMNKIQIRGGNASFAPSDLRRSEIGRYVLHHRRPILYTGQVYSIDNLMIASPKFNYEVLPYNYHYNKGLNLNPIGFARDSNVYTNSYRISLIPPT